MGHNGADSMNAVGGFADFARWATAVFSADFHGQVRSKLRSGEREKLGNLERSKALGTWRWEVL